MTAECDHTSVGVIVSRDDRILLIERKRPPFGFAPPAGHVDKRASFRKAATEELAEEVGLLAISLKFLVEGRKDNHCRRERGDWHFWKIYEADAIGSIEESDQEVTSVRWVSKEEIEKLATRTEEFMKGTIDDEEWKTSPGLEPVWYLWFRELGILNRQSEVAQASSSNRDWAGDREIARQYAWNWFVYHANQRLMVFRFFLIFVAITSAGYLASVKEKLFGASLLLSAVLFVATILFWRLDVRNTRLVKIAEAYLRKDEERLFDMIGHGEIRLTREADKRPEGLFVNLKVYSFREIYRYIFVVTGMMSILAIVIALAKYLDIDEFARFVGAY